MYIHVQRLESNQPSSGQDSVHSGDTVSRGDNLHKVVRLHHAGSGLQHGPDDKVSELALLKLVIILH